MLVPNTGMKDVELLLLAIVAKVPCLEHMQIAARSAQLVVCHKLSGRDRGSIAGSWHRDVYSPYPGFVTIVLALNDGWTEHTGPIEICPSAPLGAQYSKNVERDFLKGHEHMMCFGSRGSFLIFDARTWHRAGSAHIAEWDAEAPSRVILQFIIHPESLQLTYTETIRAGRVTSM